MIFYHNKCCFADTVWHWFSSQCTSFWTWSTQRMKTVFALSISGSGPTATLWMWTSGSVSLAIIFWFSSFLDETLISWWNINHLNPVPGFQFRRMYCVTTHLSGWGTWLPLTWLLIWGSCTRRHSPQPRARWLWERYKKKWKPDNDALGEHFCHLRSWDKQITISIFIVTLQERGSYMGQHAQLLRCFRRKCDHQFWYVPML